MVLKFGSLRIVLIEELGHVNQSNDRMYSPLDLRIRLDQLGPRKMGVPPKRYIFPVNGWTAI